MNIDSMFTVRNKPWSHVGVSVEEALTAKDAIEIAGANWNVVSSPIFDEYGNEISGYRANIREDTGLCLGVVGSRYSILQNAEPFEFGDSLIGEGLKYEVCIVAKGGKVIVLLAKMPERFIAGDAYDPYICFVNTHDGSRAVTVCMTPMRIICNNMINMMLRSTRRAWSTAHKGDLQGKLGQARQTLGLTSAYLSNLENMADRLANQPFYMDDVFVTLDNMLALPEKATDRQKQTNMLIKDGILDRLEAPDLVQFKDTKWGFLNAVADYVDHSEPFRQTKNWQENRFLSVMHGHPLFDRAVELVGV